MSTLQAQTARRRLPGVFAAACAAALALTTPAVAAAAAPAKKPVPRAYPNCAALKKVFPHGVARTGARDVVRGTAKPVTTFVVDAATYRLNVARDGDKDGVACEKH